ncbi:hypothetical protein OIE75_29385 [Streptomyces sp. NBC_01723]|uniref:hypothetical protein n=1 Tax=Streptomyces sp. NBC_01723 TaxID=2975921 RepID=UPI002E37967B|nr:hypothetical protein [Streptomyces sp. NBC_01723]
MNAPTGAQPDPQGAAVVDLVADSLATLDTITDTAAIYVTAAAGICAALTIAATAICRAAITATRRRRHTRRELRRIEHYANHPGARQLHTTPREETP